MSLLIRKILVSHISVLELHRIRTFALNQCRISPSRLLFHLTFECDDHALPVSDIIEIGESGNALVHCFLYRDLVHSACAQVEHSVAGHQISVFIEALELYKLVVREIHIISHPFVKII